MFAEDIYQPKWEDKRSKKIITYNLQKFSIFLVKRMAAKEIIDERK